MQYFTYTLTDSVSNICANMCAVSFCVSSTSLCLNADKVVPLWINYCNGLNWSNTLVAEPWGLTLIIPNTTTEYDPESVLFTSHPHKPCYCYCPISVLIFQVPFSKLSHQNALCIHSLSFHPNHLLIPL